VRVIIDLTTNGVGWWHLYMINGQVEANRADAIGQNFHLTNDTELSINVNLIAFFSWKEGEEGRFSFANISSKW